eukprot:TRINITY_DN11146_c0_g1_i1.p2 TRINITY_DN11146_c0_g1~~TRINITY_DN11146_c0_g1_i1.p2  ORF type:complete len:104 (-),score=15.99 TRINITY_DN11146_c0_g1_i1:91-402(-)
MARTASVSAAGGSVIPPSRKATLLAKARERHAARAEADSTSNDPPAAAEAADAARSPTAKSARDRLADIRAKRAMSVALQKNRQKSISAVSQIARLTAQDADD